MTDAPKRPRAALVLGALGVVFGDIGTSPLYTLQECLASAHGVEPHRENVFGVVSLVCWAITLVVTVKYLAFLMRADNHGEGGIMALLALVPDKLRPTRPGRVGAVGILVIVGAALLFGDGMITPAISVLSAVEGLGHATHRLEPWIVPITVAILVALFAVQRRGAGKLGAFFGPIMTLWFLTLGALGLRHIAGDPSILAALSPAHAIHFFVENGWIGLRVLGGVVLAVTGAEALYADMGHFGRPPIRIAWLTLAFPCLLLCYLGQGAIFLTHPGGAAAPLYAMVGRGALVYPLVGLATAATVIASQALISGVFSMTHQATRLGMFPRVTVLHTSRDTEGQIYLPLLNWILAIACITLVIAFRESRHLAAAYGLAVSGTMVITSLVFYVVIRHTWGWSRIRAGLVVALFLCVDVPFLVANALKFFAGGYLPFLVAVVFIVVMAIWTIGRTLVAAYLASQSRPVPAFLDEVATHCQGRAPGTAVFLSSQTDTVPGTLVRIVEQFRTMHAHTVLLTVLTEHVPHVHRGQRARSENLGPGLDRVVLRFGYMDIPDVPSELGPVLGELDAGAIDKAIFILGRETFVASPRNEMGRASESIFDVLSRNARRPTDSFRIPPEQVIELGVYVDL